VNSIDQQEKTYYVLIVNNKIVDLKGEKAYQQTGVFGPIIPVLDAIKAVDSRILNYNYNADKKQLTDQWEEYYYYYRRRESSNSKWRRESNEWRARAT
jgi:hypothetical protein